MEKPQDLQSLMLTLPPLGAVKLANEMHQTRREHMKHIASLRATISLQRLINCAT